MDDNSLQEMEGHSQEAKTTPPRESMLPTRDNLKKGANAIAGTLSRKEVSSRIAQVRESIEASKPHIQHAADTAIRTMHQAPEAAGKGVQLMRESRLATEKRNRRSISCSQKWSTSGCWKRII